MDISDLDYTLPQELIAQEPLADRAASRMLLVDRTARTFEDRMFRDLPELLSPSDQLVLNDSRVFPARLIGRREGGGRTEVFLLRPLTEQGVPADPSVWARIGGPSPAGEPTLWEALARPKRRLKAGSFIRFASYLSGDVVNAAAGAEGDRIHIRLSSAGHIFECLERAGHVPLPPYVKRPDAPRDRERYQTVYASPPGSIAAPTAGLHFTPAILAELAARGVQDTFVTLHVGYGTFRPMTVQSVQEHRVDAECFEISGAAAERIREARVRDRRVVAVGTTVSRVLEHWVRLSPNLRELSGQTDLFIYPPFEFKAVGGLLTNFHLPRSSLFALVCAFVGTELAHACYRHAVETRYRFYSYGDCMLVL